MSSKSTLINTTHWHVFEDTQMPIYKDGHFIAWAVVVSNQTDPEIEDVVFSDPSDPVFKFLKSIGETKLFIFF
jgi:hypothetical protein